MIIVVGGVSITMKCLSCKTWSNSRVSILLKRLMEHFIMKSALSTRILFSPTLLCLSLFMCVCVHMFLCTYMYKIMRVKGYLCCLYHKYTEICVVCAVFIINIQRFLLVPNHPPVEHRSTIQRFVLSLL